MHWFEYDGSTGEQWNKSCSLKSEIALLKTTPVDGYNNNHAAV